VIETPALDPASAAHVSVQVLGSTKLADWTIPVAPAQDTTGQPPYCEWYEPKGVLPAKMFFIMKVELK